MELYFLGRGAAFNPKEGNTSAYFIEDNQLFLIDCGESIFEKIIEKNILNNISIINIMITHTHSDHIGSIGSLINYSYYVLKKHVNIILPQSAKHKNSIFKILECFGCYRSMYKFVEPEEYDSKYESFQKIRYVETKHCDDLASYGLLFNTNKGIVYYSGDTNEIDIVKNLISNNILIDKLYLDTTTLDIPNNAHLYIGIIDKNISGELRNHVYCIHLNSDDCIDKAKELGFNVVEII